MKGESSEMAILPFHVHRKNEIDRVANSIADQPVYLSMPLL